MHRRKKLSVDTGVLKFSPFYIRFRIGVRIEFKLEKFKLAAMFAVAEKLSKDGVIELTTLCNLIEIGREKKKIE